MPEYRTEAQTSLLDLLDFILEQIECARHLSDRAAAIDAARGVVPYLRDRLEGTEFQSKLVLLFGDLMFAGHWSENWTVKESEAEFTTFAKDLVERVNCAKDILEQPMPYSK
jgi:uncharacterized protein (DUF2267 family)